MSDGQLYMVFDVESDGLHGDGFAVGWVVVKGDDRLAEGAAAARVDVTDRWVKENVEPNLAPPTHETLREMRDEFWSAWQHWREREALLAADVPWPVEARFLAACIDDDFEARRWSGPYPLIDIASVRLAAGFNPLATEDRLWTEMPQHQPLMDARQSARLLIEALSK